MHGSLFSGIGGLDLGVTLATGSRPAWLVESDPYCRAVLRARFPGVPLLADVRDVNASTVQRIPMIVGGFPCQDVSQVGKRKGLSGARSGLWREYARIIRELRPRIVFVENVAGLLARGLDEVIGDLAALGFDAEWSCLRASDVGAPHLRRRVFVLAWDRLVSDAVRDTLRQQCRRREPGDDPPEPRHDRKDMADTESVGGEDAYQRRWQPDVVRSHAGMADTDNVGRARQPSRLAGEEIGNCGAPWHDALRRHAWPPGPADAEAWARWAGAMPGIRRGSYGLPRSMDAHRRRERLRVLGNSVVPQQAAAAFEALSARALT